MDKQRIWELYFAVTLGQPLGLTTSYLQEQMLLLGASKTEIKYLSPFLACPSALRDEDYDIFAKAVAAQGRSLRTEILRLHFFANDVAADCICQKM